MRGILLAALLLCAGGCDSDTARDPPPPVAEIELTADGGIRLDGRPITLDRLDAELTRRIADAPQTRTGRTKQQARIRHAPGVGYDRVIEMQERCQRLGISQVEVPR